ncbi:hypothetical protein BKA62DRAFT_761814 [Auriculariales sp. MPI-PUGE-AT-0066]|nr:hypothetical protein BKA62DRAFT_761814 [Auriculariales sp. MPI-PUGE-AT-0066]
MSTDKQGAYGNAASEGSHRRKWDDEAYREKAREKDREERERMQENEERMRKGQKPIKGVQKKEDLPKPVETMKQREGSLELERNLNKTVIVQNNSNRRQGAGQPGFYCEVCDRNHKDSTGYLDHLNSRAHLRRLGQSTRLERSTVEQVRERIAMLREKTREQSKKKEYDFAQRMKEIRDKETTIREERKAEKQRAKDAARAEVIALNPEADAMAAMMGFSGFGTTSKK